MNRRELGAAALLVALATQLQGVSAQTTVAVNPPTTGFAIEHASAFNPRQMYGLMSDLFTRSYFADLRALPNWGPDHPAWSRHLPAFSEEMLTLLLPQGVALNAHLSRGLQQELTVKELSDLNAYVSRPEFIAAINRLEEGRLSWSNLVLIQTVIREPKFYSAAERAQAKAVVSSFQGEVSGEREVALKAKLKPAAEFLASPAFLKYQSAVGRTFMADAKRMGETPEKQRGFELLMQRWHVRLKSGG